MFMETPRHAYRAANAPLDEDFDASLAYLDRSDFAAARHLSKIDKISKGQVAERIRKKTKGVNTR